MSELGEAPLDVSWIRSRAQPLVMAHRGASDLEPENTLAAFERALADGCDAIETDLWMTADRHFVCHHDATAERMTGDPRRIDKLEAAELKRLRVRGNRGESHAIPLLDELLDVVPERIPVALELKDPQFASPQVLAALHRSIAARLPRRTVAVITTEIPLLRRLGQLSPELPTGHINLRRPMPASIGLLAGPFWPLLYVNPWFVRLAHRQGQLVCPLDPQLHRRLGRYLRLGVDAVLTNDPAATRRLIESS